MIVASIASLAAGTALASTAERHPEYVAALERCAGVLMIAGLVLIGHLLPFVP